MLKKTKRSCMPKGRPKEEPTWCNQNLAQSNKFNFFLQKGSLGFLYENGLVPMRSKQLRESEGSLPEHPAVGKSSEDDWEDLPGKQRVLAEVTPPWTVWMQWTVGNLHWDKLHQRGEEGNSKGSPKLYRDSAQLVKHYSSIYKLLKGQKETRLSHFRAPKN